MYKELTVTLTSSVLAQYIILCNWLYCRLCLSHFSLILSHYMQEKEGRAKWQSWSYFARPKWFTITEVTPLPIAEANKDALAAMRYVEPKKNIKISPECKAKITKYTIKNSNCATAKKLGKSLGKPLNETTIHSWVVICTYCTIAKCETSLCQIHSHLHFSYIK